MRIPEAPAGLPRPQPGGAPVSEVSLGGLPQDRLVQFRDSEQSLQPCGFLLERLQALRLIRLYTAVLLPPPEVRRVRDPQQLSHRRHSAAPGELDVRLTQLVDDLLRLETLAWHGLTS